MLLVIAKAAPPGVPNSFECLIFDLDDTLLDTWGQLVRPAAREACEAMILAGLAADIEASLAMRSRLFQKFPRGDVYALMVDHFGVRGTNISMEEVRAAGHCAYFNRDVSEAIFIEPATFNLLERLKRNWRLYLVTSGSPVTQGQKIDKLRLAPFFEEIILVDRDRGGSKLAAFRRILERASVQPCNCLCIGDRVDREIKAANRLGMVTCRMFYGEFRHVMPRRRLEHPDFQIESIDQLAAILKLPVSGDLEPDDFLGSAS